MPSSTRLRWLTLPLVAVALFAGSFAGTAWASHVFNDVPDSNPFHDDIAAVADAGITTGFADGGFHPGDPITRQAMAAFVHRGLGRVDGSNGFATFSDTASHNLAAGTITAGAASGSGGYVVVLASATFSTASEGLCPCKVGLSVTDGTLVSGQRNATIANVAGADGSAYASVSTSFIYEIGPGETKTYRAQGFRADSIAGSPSTSMASNLVALYVPFDGAG